MTKYTLIKIIRSHTELARFLGLCSSEPIGYVPRDPSIPSPYAYSQTHVVYQHGAARVFVIETSHRVYRVFTLDPIDVVYPEGWT